MFVGDWIEFGRFLSIKYIIRCYLYFFFADDCKECFDQSQWIFVLLTKAPYPTCILFSLVWLDNHKKYWYLYAHVLPLLFFSCDLFSLISPYLFVIDLFLIALFTTSIDLIKYNVTYTKASGRFFPTEHCLTRSFLI